ncbi:Tetratricopeptide repeat domain 12 [Nesidiocoris tenuis]|uniref:Tetratricopeptide repeat domain 12 n=1 Tax=Nesidiocoris tenuis TaxID=355587 RepID=A0ABN7ATN7_9HEMI|nr:Tetratricopeptide repeat domain 12 [Nesidiocoris tenuis]
MEDDLENKGALDNFHNSHRAFEDDFSNFMNKVGVVEDVLKRLSSNDSRISRLAMNDADQLLNGKTEVDEDDLRIKNDRTVVNQKGFDKFEQNPDEGPAKMEANEFMRQVEADCKQRADDRKERKLESDRHKNEGNKAFREQRYAKALVSYDKAIDALKDSCILYCNRSLTYLKLGLPEKALKDAEMSLKANDKSLRGFVYKAQALWQMGKENESIATIEEACEVVPDKKDYLRGLLEEWRNTEMDIPNTD